MQSITLSYRRALVLVLVVLVTSTSTKVCANPKVYESNPEATFVLDQFRNKTLSDCLKIMDRLRPAAVTPDEKNILRKEGFHLVSANTEIRDPAELAKLYAETQEVLDFHHRAGIVEYILFKNADPIAQTKAGAFIALSARLWQLGEDKDGRSGIIAHELSHEYFAMQFLEAYQARDCQKLRVIELECDAFATITLLSLKLNPDRYADALARIVHHSKASEQLNDGNQGMPSLDARLRVIKEIKKRYLQAVTATA